MQVEVPDDHQLVVGLPNMWTVVKVVDRVSGNPVTGPDVQVTQFQVYEWAGRGETGGVEHE